MGVVSAPLAAAGVGALFGLGVFVIVAGWSGQLAPPRRNQAPRRSWDRLTWRVGLALSGTAVALVLTRWPVVVLAAGVVGWLAPSFVGLRATRRRQLAKAEAVAVWAEMLRDLLTANAGLIEAIGKSARVAPTAIRDEVAALYVRAQRGELTVALARFADELDDAIADTIVAALQLADRRAVSDLGALLAAVAASTRETVAMQLRVDVNRARTYRTAQLIAIVVGFFVAVMVLANREYLSPFGTLTGQLVLGAVAALVGVSVWALIALARPPRAERLLAVGTSGSAP